MNKVVNSCDSGQHQQSDRDPIHGFFGAVQVVWLDFFLISSGQDESRSTSGVRRLTGNDNLPAVQISGGEVSSMSASSGKNARRWCRPGGELGFSSFNSERISSEQADYLSPWNSNGDQRVMYLDSAFAEDDFRCYSENPNYGGDGIAVSQGEYRLGKVTSLKKRIENQAHNYQSYNKVNPAGFVSENMNILHSFEITGNLLEQFAANRYSVRKVAA